MQRFLPMIVLLAAVLFSGTAKTQTDPAEAPLTLDEIERETVRLVVVDTVVVDAAGRTVPDLGRADFRLVVDGKEREIDTLDVDCSRSLPDPQVVR